MSFRYKNLKSSPRGEGYPYRVSSSLPRDSKLSYEGINIPRRSRGVAAVRTNSEDRLQMQGHEMQQGKLHCVLQKMAFRRSQRRSKTADKENSPSALRGGTYRAGGVEMYSNPSRAFYSTESLSSSSSNSVSDPFSSCELQCNESGDIVHFKKHTAALPAASQQPNRADSKSQQQQLSSCRTLNAQSGDHEIARSGVDKKGKPPLQRIPLRSVVQKDLPERLQSDKDPVSL